MKKLEFDTSKIKLAQIRYFSEDRQSTEIPSIQGYVFLVNIDGNYVNIFNPTEKVNVYDRLPYTNTTLDGEDYGNKIVICCGEVCEGICYVIEPFSVRSLIKKDKVTYQELERVVIHSKYFFIDRKNILGEKQGFINNRIKFRKILKKDRKNLNELEDYLNKKGSFQYKK